MALGRTEARKGRYAAGEGIMSRTYRKYPHGIERTEAVDPTRDGIAWKLPSTRRHLKRTMSSRDRREWLYNTERHKLAARERLIWS